MCPVVKYSASVVSAPFPIKPLKATLHKRL